MSRIWDYGTKRICFDKIHEDGSKERIITRKRKGFIVCEEPGSRVVFSANERTITEEDDEGVQQEYSSINWTRRSFRMSDVKQNVFVQRDGDMFLDLETVGQDWKEASVRKLSIENLFNELTRLSKSEEMAAGMIMSVCEELRA